MVYRNADIVNGRIRAEDVAKAPTHLDRFEDLQIELCGRLEVPADDWDESEIQGEELKALP
jgi:hypothetical protein